MKCIYKTYEGPRTKEDIKALISKLTQAGWLCEPITNSLGELYYASIYRIQKDYSLDYWYGIQSRTSRWRRGKIEPGKISIEIGEDGLEKFLENYQFTERRCEER